MANLSVGSIFSDAFKDVFGVLKWSFKLLFKTGSATKKVSNTINDKSKVVVNEKAFNQTGLRNKPSVKKTRMVL